MEFVSPQDPLSKMRPQTRTEGRDLEVLETKVRWFWMVLVALDGFGVSIMDKK